MILYILFFWYLLCAFEQICYPDGYLLSSSTQISILFMFMFSLMIVSFYLVITYFYTFQLTPILSIFTFIIIVYNIIYALVIFLSDMNLNDSQVNTKWNQFGPVYKSYFTQDKNKFKDNYQHNMMVAGIFHLILALIYIVLIFNLLIYHRNVKAIQQESQSKLTEQQFIPKINSHAKPRFPKKKLLMRDKQADLKKFASENLQMFNDMRKNNKRKKMNDVDEQQFQDDYNERNRLNQAQGLQQGYGYA